MGTMDWGWGVDDTAAALLQKSGKARQNGEAYELLIARNAAVAVARRQEVEGEVPKPSALLSIRTSSTSSKGFGVDMPVTRPDAHNRLKKSLRTTHETWPSTLNQAAARSLIERLIVALAVSYNV